MSAPDATPARGDDMSLFLGRELSAFRVANQNLKEDVKRLTAERDALAARVRAMAAGPDDAACDVVIHALDKYGVDINAWEYGLPVYRGDYMEEMRAAIRAALASTTRIPTATPYAPADARGIAPASDAPTVGEG